MYMVLLGMNNKFERNRRRSLVYLAQRPDMHLPESQHNNLLHLNIATHARAKEGRNWQVLTFGEYADRSSALQAWTGATENHEKISVWVRPVQP